MTAILFGKRTKARIVLTDPGSGLAAARKLFQKKRFSEAFDVYEQLVEACPQSAIDLLAEVWECYQRLPNQGRYQLYQSRHFDFGIQPGDKVLDIGSGHDPFPLATHLADLALRDDRYGRGGVPFKHIEGKPVFECGVEEMHFKDKEFDFVYCSHVLEHVENPEKACEELMRVAKRGYIETPTRGKDLWLNTAKSSNHRWAVEWVHDRLVFTEYLPWELEGFQCNVAMEMHVRPQTKREQALSALIYLKADRVNTMLLWDQKFDFEVRRVEKTADIQRESVAIAPPQNRVAADFAGAPLRVSRKDADPSSLGGEKTAANPRCVFLNIYYPAFLASHYRKHPELAQGDWKEQKDRLFRARFGDSDFYSRGLVEAGWETEELVTNCAPLQQAWAREAGITFPTGNDLELVLEQIRRFRPDVVYIQSFAFARPEFLEALRPHTRLIVGQIASLVPPYAHPKGLDLIFSSLPHFVERFRKDGIAAYYQPLAFETRVLSELTEVPRDIAVSFVGGLSTLHREGTELLEKLANLVPIEFWGYGVESLPAASEIRRRHHGEAWGMDMFSLLRRSRMTINRHGQVDYPSEARSAAPQPPHATDSRHTGVAAEFANNMRLFEATGCGALLITDYKENLNELFEIGKEVVAYRSSEECAALVKYYLAHPSEAEKIARAGQERTLRDHTYSKRMVWTSEILRRRLRYRNEAQQYGEVDLATVSTGHAVIPKEQVTAKMISAWKDEKLPQRQRALVQKELSAMYRGQSPRSFQALAEILRPILRADWRILEIGCASGYYFEILEYLLNQRLDYTGVDYSEAMIQMARGYYPRPRFYAADGAALFFADKEFDVVISGTVLLHAPNYREHVFETAQVAGRFVVAHRTPICRRGPTQHLRKLAYGIETVELIFNEGEFLREFQVNQFELFDQRETSSNSAADRYEISYVFKRKN